MSRGRRFAERIHTIVGDDEEALEILAAVCELMAARRQLLGRAVDVIAARRGSRDAAVLDLFELGARYQARTFRDLKAG